VARRRCLLGRENKGRHWRHIGDARDSGWGLWTSLDCVAFSALVLLKQKAAGDELRRAYCVDTSMVSKWVR
jgi:hypothetical protein